MPTPFQPGDRVSHRRRSCLTHYGTVLAVLAYDDEAHLQWVRVRWDHGPVNEVDAAKLKPSRQPAPEVLPTLADLDAGEHSQSEAARPPSPDAEAATLRRALAIIQSKARPPWSYNVADLQHALDTIHEIASAQLTD